jgi:predicted nucleic acid-binding protein
VIVLDASAAIEWLCQTAVGRRVGQRLGDEPLAAPHVIDLEVAQVMRRYVSARAMSAGRADEVLQDLSDVRLTRYPHTPLLPRIWELRANLTAYDAAYVALAEALDSRLITCDSRVAAAPGSRARIDVLR